MKNTLLDISTSMLQIAGRIRDSRYKNEITLIYNTTRYEEVDDLESYKRKVAEELRDARKDQKALNQCSKGLRSQIIEHLREYNAPFIRPEGDEIIVDMNMVNLDLVSYKIIHGLYKTQVMMDAELQKSNIEVVEDKFDGRKFVELMSCKRISFKDCCEQYSAIKSKPIVFSFDEDERLIRLRNSCPEACEAVDKLGIEEIRKEKYHKTNILRKMVRKCDSRQEVKIKEEIARRIKMFQTYTPQEIKRILGEIYSDVNLGKVPAISDLKNYRVKRTKRNGQDVIILEGERIMMM